MTNRLALVFFCFTPLCTAEEVTIPADPAVTILQRAPEKSEGYLAIRDQLNVVLLGFDVSALPTESNVERATLEMRVTTTEKYAREAGEVEERPAVLFRVHRVLSPWGQGVSWARADHDLAWIDDGTVGPLSLSFLEHDSLGQIEALPGGSEPFNAQLDVTEWAKASIKDPTSSHGLALVLDYQPGYTVQANFDAGQNRPQLRIELAR